MVHSQVVIDEGDTLVRLSSYLLEQAAPQMPEHQRGLATDGLHRRVTHPRHHIMQMPAHMPARRTSGRLSPAHRPVNRPAPQHQFAHRPATSTCLVRRRLAERPGATTGEALDFDAFVDIYNRYVLAGSRAGGGGGDQRHHPPQPPTEPPAPDRPPRRR